MSEGDLFDNLPEAAKEPSAAPRQWAAPEAAPLKSTATETETAAPPPEPEPFVAAEVPPPPPPPPDPEPAAEKVPPPPPPEPKPRRHAELPRTGSLGQTLAELRRRTGMDIRTVADETRIKSCYIEALEKDDFAELPHMVYALAYVKKLCGVYGVSEADSDELMGGLREQLAYEIPEDIDKSVICREQDEETRRKVQQITIGLFVGAALIVLLLVIGGTTLILRSRSAKKARSQTEEVLGEDWLAQHRKPQTLKSTRLKRAPRR